MSSDLKLKVKTAIDECKTHAKINHYRTVSDIAEIMNVDTWVLFKWLEKSRIPAEEIPAFEKACGCNALTKCIAEIAGLLTIPAQTGCFAVVKNSADVHLHVANAMFEALKSEGDVIHSKDAVKSISQAIESLAWLRHQISVSGDKNV